MSKDTFTGTESVDPIKVGKNQISEIDGLWNIEVFEFLEDDIPMYSVWDATPSKAIALKYAKLVTRSTGYDGFYAKQFREDNEKIAKRKK